MIEILPLRCDHSCLVGATLDGTNKLKGRERPFSVMLQSSRPRCRSTFLLQWVLVFTVESFRQHSQSTASFFLESPSMTEEEYHYSSTTIHHLKVQLLMWQLCACQIIWTKNRRVRFFFWKHLFILFLLRLNPSAGCIKDQQKENAESRVDEWDESGCQWNRGHLGYHDAAHARRLSSPRLHFFNWEYR